MYANFLFYVKACPEIMEIWEAPPDLGYDYFISVDNLGVCVNETLTNPTSYICEKFAGDHPDYSYGGTVARINYPKGCFVHTPSNKIMYNTDIDGASDKDDVSFDLMLFCMFCLSRQRKKTTFLFQKLK